jgi:hypothetical protein
MGQKKKWLSPQPRFKSHLEILEQVGRQLSVLPICSQGPPVGDLYVFGEKKTKLLVISSLCTVLLLVLAIGMRLCGEVVAETSST